MKNNWVVVFDLDDTLYKEIDFLKSAYKEIAKYLSSKTNESQTFLHKEMISYYINGLNVFEEILTHTKIKDVCVQDLLSIYREHVPDISLDTESVSLLNQLRKNNFKMGLITDGRSKQQRNKIKALKLGAYISDIVISEEIGTEKSNVANFKYFNDIYLDNKFMYIGYNTAKDFIAPNSLGWTIICLLDNGHNIHKMNLDLNSNKEMQPIVTINSLSELKIF